MTKKSFCFMKITILALSFLCGCAAHGIDERQIKDTIQSFYFWASENRETVSRLEPQIVYSPGGGRVHLDVSTLSDFSGAFMASGLFSAEFRTAIEYYYLKYRLEIDMRGDKIFDSIHTDGRSPIMESENMDIYFCAQEYSYDRDFINATRIKDLEINGDKAVVKVVSHYNWETTFLMQKVSDQWLISGYCLYQ